MIANRDLQLEISHLKSTFKKEPSEDVQSGHEAFKIQYEWLEKELALKNTEIQEIVNQNNNYKTEVKCVNAKHDKVKSETKSLKDEKEILETKTKELSVALKSSKMELKESTKRYDCDRKNLEKEIEALMNYKIKHETNTRELKKKQKKLNQKFKKETKKAAEVEIEKMKESRKKMNVNDLDDTVTDAKTEIINNNAKDDTASSAYPSKDATIADSNKCLPPRTLNFDPKPEPKAMSDEEFKKLLEQHFDSFNSSTSTIVSKSIQEAFAAVEAKFDEVDKSLDEYLARPKISFS